MDEQFDFEGWGTRFNVRCTDGRTIDPAAFKHNDGKKVAMVWNHRHDSPEFVIGHAYLFHRAKGMWVKGKFNDTYLGQVSKELLHAGDITGLSICANQLREQGKNVMHGEIRELSLVIASANPEAFIENVIAHGDDAGEEVVIYLGTAPTLYHSDEPKEEPEVAEETKKNENETEENKEGTKKTLQEILDTMNPEQRNATNALVAMALDEAGVTDDDDDEEEDSMKHNAFDNETEVTTGGVLTHADQQAILELARSSRCGSLQEAIKMYCEESDTLKHSFEALNHSFEEGEDGIEMLFPEFKDVKPGAPELLTRDQTWVGVFMNKVHKSPIARIRTRQADITNAINRAKGHLKGNQKVSSVLISLLKRKTSPWTVYVKDELSKQDIDDITDFDVVNYTFGAMRILLDEELALAAMIGDGREPEDDDKIPTDNIRPIWLDDETYTIHRDVDVATMTSELQGTNTAANFGEDYIFARAFVKTARTARETYKGSGNPDMFIEPHTLNRLMLAHDMNGRLIYNTENELAKALSVNSINTAEQFAEQVRTDSQTNRHKLLALFINLNDYTLGAVRGGKISRFQQFDIDYNKEKMLLETRVSGALTRVKSAIALEEPVT